jgi:hypothetical protein
LPAVCRKRTGGCREGLRWCSECVLGIPLSGCVGAVSHQYEYGAIRPQCSDPVSIALEGPGLLLGEPFAALSGGVTAVWVRTTNERRLHLLQVKYNLSEANEGRVRSVSITLTRRKCTFKASTIFSFGKDAS